MLPADKLLKLQSALAGFSKDELLWASGYAFALTGDGVVAVPQGKPLVNKITVAYGTETGNSKKIALQLANAAKKSGITVKQVALDQYRTADLDKEEYFFLALSTHGDGEAPDAAKKFYDFVHNGAPQLPKMKYSVVALGDSVYPLFCKAGADVDERFAALGAKSILPRVDCDVDYLQDADAWVNSVMQLLLEKSADAQPAIAKPAPLKSGRHVYSGKIVSNINLNDNGSAKATHHIEIACDETVDYVPGDSLAVIAHNPLALVKRVLQLIGATGGEQVALKKETVSLQVALSSKLNLLRLPKRVLDKYATATNAKPAAEFIDTDELLIASPLPKDFKLQQFIDLLEPIAPRYYSIASSAAAHNGEVHVLVSRVVYALNGKPKSGLASNFLSDLPEGTALSFFIQKNDAFRLPADDKNIIMIGPGTGVAPFRAFVAERDSRGAGGKNWLFFGDQHFKKDFLYQSEWLDYLQNGALHRMDVAFSRDTKQKVYVQHKLKAQAAEVYQWLAGGAHIYVCGSKYPMSHDVENALIEIIADQGNKSPEEAQQLLHELKEEGRYLKDVY